MISRASLGCAITLFAQTLFVGCTTPAYAPDSSYIGPFAPGAQRYGVDGTLSAKQYAVLKGLAWPQAYSDMIGTFGFPTYRTSTSDYYAVASDKTIWAVVHYSGKTAQSYSLEPRYE